MIFSVPEAGILGNLYVLARPNLGVATSAVMVQQGFCRQPYEIDFCDPQVHLPCPESFRNFSLPNGLSLEVTKPLLGYHVDYEASLGRAAASTSTSTPLCGRSTCTTRTRTRCFPRATTGPSRTRRATPRPRATSTCSGRVTGEFELRGRRYQVDCVDGMDHSWGPRSEESAGTGSRAASWIHVVVRRGLRDAPRDVARHPRRRGRLRRPALRLRDGRAARSSAWSTPMWRRPAST